MPHLVRKVAGVKAIQSKRETKAKEKAEKAAKEKEGKSGKE